MESGRCMKSRTWSVVETGTKPSNEIELALHSRIRVIKLLNFAQ